MAAVTICSGFGAPQNKFCHCFHSFPIYLPWTDGTRWHDLRFLNAKFYASFFKGLKLNILKTNIMAFGAITSWQIHEETVDTATGFIFLDSKITADDDCCHEIKRCSLLGRKVMMNLNSILKSRDITLPAKVCIVKAMVFPVIVYGCESWAIKKAERWRIDVF